MNATKTLTEAQLRKAGYELTRGAYYGTSDDRADRWYIEAIDARAVDRRGPGYATKREALQVATERQLDQAV